MTDIDKYMKVVAKGAGIIFLGMLIGHFINYFSQILMARYLGVSDYGLLMLAFTIVQALTILSLLGFDLGSARFISCHRDNKSKLSGIFRKSIKFILITSFISSIFLFLFSNQLALLFNSPGLSPILRIFSFLVIPLTLFNLLVSFMRGLKLSGSKIFCHDILYPIFKLVIFILMLYSGYVLFGAVIAIMFSVMFATAFSIYYLLIRKEILSIIKIKPNFRLKELFLFSWPLLLAGVLSLIFNWIGVMSLGYFKTTFEVGIYSVALITAGILWIILRSFNFLFMPVVSELFAKNRFDDIKILYKIITRWIFLLSFPIFLIMAFFPDLIINFFFGQKYMAAALPFMILSFGYIFANITGPTGTTIIAFGKTKLNLLISISIAVSNFILCILLIPLYGVIGAAVAMFFTVLIGNGLGFFFVYRFMKIQPYDINYFRYIFSGLLSVLIVYFIIYINSALQIILISLIAFPFLYLFFLLMFKSFNDHDISLLESFGKKFNINLKPFINIIKKGVRTS